MLSGTAFGEVVMSGDFEEFLDEEASFIVMVDGKTSSFHGNQ